jgi:ribonuclease HII
MLKQFHTRGSIEAGCDEAGRGCLAGPVFAAAVILPADYKHPALNDSKKLSQAQRLFLRDDIQARALAWKVASVSPEEIDVLNILNASIQAMHRALGNLPIRPERILVDGNRFYPFEDIPFECVVKGDGKFNSIAAASILAKTYRDEYMERIDAEYPMYRWKKNKGYPTRDHRDGIAVHGISPHHRKSFRLNEQMRLFIR